MTNPAAVVVFLAFAPIVLMTGVMVAVESWQWDKDLPTLDDYRAGASLAVRYVGRGLDEDRPRTRGDVLRDLAWVVFGPALAVRFLIHVGAGVAIRGGDPGPINARRVLASPVVDVDDAPFADLQLRLATFCYGLFWLLFGTRNMDPAGLIFFGVQVSVLLIDPCPWAGARVLSLTESENMTTHNETEDGAQATGGAD